jgi:hypothetical protein
MLLSSLEAVLRGRRDLFQGLWIDGSDYDWRPRPVIILSLGGIGVNSPADLKKRLSAQLKSAAGFEGLRLYKTDPSKAFEELIKGVSEKRGREAAVLIGDYDDQVLYKMLEPALAREFCGVLADFMEALRRAEEWRGPALVTGVLRLKNVVATSGPGSLVDLTLDEDYADVCGFTAEQFGEYLNQRKKAKGSRNIMEAIHNCISEGLLPPTAKIKEFREKALASFDGYCWDGKTRLINPGPVDDRYNYVGFYDKWFSSNTSQITELLSMNTQIHKVVRTQKPLTQAENFVDLGDISPAALFFQAGFLTVDSVDKGSGNSRFRLRFPNPKIEASIWDRSLGASESERWLPDFRAGGREMLEALARQDASKFDYAFFKLESTKSWMYNRAKRSYPKFALFAAFEEAGQRFDSAGPPGDEIYFARLEAENSPGLVIKMRYLHNEMKELKLPGLAPAMLELSDTESRLRTEKAAKEVLAQIDERKSLISFKSEPSEIYKCALVSGDFFRETKAFFEKAENWRLAPDGAGRYVVE